MDHCILFRNTTSGRIGFVSDDDGEIAIFPDEDAAISAAEHTVACQIYPHMIVYLDEL